MDTDPSGRVHQDAIVLGRGDPAYTVEVWNAGERGATKECQTHAEALDTAFRWFDACDGLLPIIDENAVVRRYEPLGGDDRPRGPEQRT